MALNQSRKNDSMATLTSRLIFVIFGYEEKLWYWFVKIVKNCDIEEKSEKIQKLNDLHKVF